MEMTWGLRHGQHLWPNAADATGGVVSIRWLIEGVTDILGGMLEKSNVLVVLTPSTDDVDVQIDTPTVVVPAMVYLLSLCCQLLGQEGGSIDFRATPRTGTVDITMELFPRPHFESLPLQFSDVQGAMRAVGNPVCLHENTDRLYFTISLPHMRRH